MLARTLKALRNEAGNLMITTLIGSIVLLVVVGAIASGIVGILLFQKTVSDKSEVTNQAALTDSAFRNDVQWASKITATDALTVHMTVPGQGGHCKESTWAITTAGTTTTVDLTVISYPTVDASVNPVACSGTPTEPTSQTLVKDASPGSTFTYANPGGRELTFASGAVTIAGTATVPSGVPAKEWASPKLAAVALNTVVANSTDRRADYRFSQTADNLSVVQEAADAPQHFVPEGNLTALP